MALAPTIAIILLVGYIILWIIWKLGSILNIGNCANIDCGKPVSGLKLHITAPDRVIFHLACAPQKIHPKSKHDFCGRPKL